MESSTHKDSYEPRDDLPRIIEDLARSEAYPHPADRLTLHQTHISIVFLAGEHAYKIKKPVNLGFLDYSSLEKRLHYAFEELRLNRRLSHSVYLGVEPITFHRGRHQVGGPGPTVEYAVHMRRIPEDRTFLALAQRDRLTAAILGELVDKLVDFYRAAASGERISSLARFDVVCGNARENFSQIQAFSGWTIERDRLEQLRRATELELERRHGLIQSRAARHVPRETHGDLRLEHVYRLGEGVEGIEIIDCIEFCDRFRFADPVADIAFLVMDFIRIGRRDLADLLADLYFARSGDEEGRALLPLYVAYRATVRGKVESFKLEEAEIPTADRQRAAKDASGYFDLAIVQLEADAA